MVDPSKNVQLFMHQVQDQQTINKYKELYATMLDIIAKHQNLFSDLSHKHMSYLSMIPDPSATSAQTSRDHLRPPK